jgi:hypothetical protein
MATRTRITSKPASQVEPGGGLSRIEGRTDSLPRVRADVALTFDDVLLVPAHSVTHPKEVATS